MMGLGNSLEILTIYMVSMAGTFFICTDDSRVFTFDTVFIAFIFVRAKDGQLAKNILARPCE